VQIYIIDGSVEYSFYQDIDKRTLVSTPIGVFYVKYFK